MNHIRRFHPVRRVAGALAVLAAFALPVPPAGGGDGTGYHRPGAHRRRRRHAGWQIAFIAPGAAVAVILDRARAARRHLAAPSA